VFGRRFTPSIQKEDTDLCCTTCLQMVHSTMAAISRCVLHSKLYSDCSKRRFLGGDSHPYPKKGQQLVLQHLLANGAQHHDRIFQEEIDRKLTPSIQKEETDLCCNTCLQMVHSTMAEFSRCVLHCKLRSDCGLTHLAAFDFISFSNAFTLHTRHAGLRS
jgi:hypothetical protein